MMIRIIIFILFCLGISSPCQAQWPLWLGEQLQDVHREDWKIESSERHVRFSPRKAQPEVWVLVSRKAQSYDTAVSTVLGVYRSNFSTATFQIFLLPGSPQELTEWLSEAEKQASLIYTVGSKATVAMHKAYAGGRLPVVSVNAKDPVMLGLTDSYDTSGNNFAFTSLNLPAEVTLSYLTRFNTQLAQIGILFAKRNTSAYLTQYLPLKKAAEESGLRVFGFEVDETRPDHTLNKVVERQVAKMRETDPGFDRSLLWLTGSSSLLERVRDINTCSGGLPLLTTVPDVVNGSDNSALMSVGVGFENNAHQAALYGIRILKDGVAPKTLPVGVLSPPDISISFKQAERIHAKIPFVLVEMASDIYAQDGRIIRKAGMRMER